MNPLSAVHILGRLSSDERDFATLGSCFTFRRRTHVLTAAHCVGSLSSAEIAVLSRGRDGILTRRAKSVERHPTADLALLTLPDHEQDAAEPFWNYVGNYSLGEDFIAYGYPEDIFGPNGRSPTPRLFKGHFQRFLRYDSKLGYSYVAGELNIGCPGGLSGGPLFRPGAHVMLTGLVTENHESTTVLHSVEEVEADGKAVKVMNRAVINYGMCLMLAELADWIDARVPRRQV